jgi:hypothetical protein
MKLRQSHEFQTEEEFKNYLEAVIANDDFHPLDKAIRNYIKQFFFGGFDTFEDYMKYGDAFVSVEFKEDDVNL